MNHTLLDYGVMWAASFALVFLLGLQSKNVQRSRYLAAIITSFGISVGNFTFIKYAAAGTLDAFFICAVGGCMGIAFSIWFADNVMHKNHAKGDFAFQKGPPSLFGEQREGSIPLTPQMRSALEDVGRRAMQRTFSQKLDTLTEVECHLQRTGIPMPGEKNT